MKFQLPIFGQNPAYFMQALVSTFNLNMKRNKNKSENRYSIRDVIYAGEKKLSGNLGSISYA